MAAIVLVHGIGQESADARLLEQTWTPALVEGLRAAGGSASAIGEPRMAFYADLFTRPGAQGGEVPDLSPRQLQVAGELAAVWLAAAAERAADPRDRDVAAAELYAVSPDAPAQGAVALAGRPAINALTKVRWFAEYGFDFLERFVWRALSQVSSYLTDDAIREGAQARVLDLLDADTRIVVAHSLGSVVAYEALHRHDRPVALLTLGSPLALETVILPRLRPQPPAVPRCLRAWTNLADRDDIVAARVDLGPYFPPQPGSTVIPVTPPDPIDNGAQPHDVRHYLRKPQSGHAIAAALG